MTPTTWVLTSQCTSGWTWRAPMALEPFPRRPQPPQTRPPARAASAGMIAIALWPISSLAWWASSCSGASWCFGSTFLSATGSGATSGHRCRQTTALLGTFQVHSWSNWLGSQILTSPDNSYGTASISSCWESTYTTVELNTYGFSTRRFNTSVGNNSGSWLIHLWMKSDGTAPWQLLHHSTSHKLERAISDLTKATKTYVTILALIMVGFIWLKNQCFLWKTWTIVRNLDLCSFCLRSTSV